MRAGVFADVPCRGAKRAQRLLVAPEAKERLAPPDMGLGAPRFQRDRAL